MKPNINHCNKDGTTLLHAAVRCRNVVRERAPWASLSRAVSRSGARTRECVCLLWRVELKDVVRLLLERGANMDLATERADVDEVEVSPLGTEAAKHNQPCVT